MDKTTRRNFFSQCACCTSTPALRGEGPSRRAFLAGGAAATASGIAATAVPAAAQTPAAGVAKPRRIDVHHHIIPPVQAERFTRHQLRPSKWSVEGSLADMDKAGITTAITSIQNPGVWFGQADDESRKLARDCNEYAARLEQDHPGRFRSFAAIPLPDTDGSLREIEYSLDVLKAEGIALWTNYTGKYLGDAAFVPVFEELNRRKAVVYTHPTGSTCCVDMMKGVSEGTVETGTETTRTIASLLFGDGGTAARFPDIRFIWSHSGGTMPFLISRFEQQTKAKPDPRLPNGPVPLLQKFYYEVAQGNSPGQIAALLKLVPTAQVMFGSDYPYRLGMEAVDGVDNYPFTVAERRAIDFENAIRVMPNLKA
jgi:predicted TIM-barrel fold metal-dependent hydrolase